MCGSIVVVVVRDAEKEQARGHDKSEPSKKGITTNNDHHNSTLLFLSTHKHPIKRIRLHAGNAQFAFHANVISAAVPGPFLHDTHSFGLHGRDIVLKTQGSPDVLVGGIKGGFDLGRLIVLARRIFNEQENVNEKDGQDDFQELS